MSSARLYTWLAPGQLDLLHLKLEPIVVSLRQTPSLAIELFSCHRFISVGPTPEASPYRSRFARPAYCRYAGFASSLGWASAGSPTPLTWPWWVLQLRLQIEQAG